MAEELQATRVWLNSQRTLFLSGALSPCSSAGPIAGKPSFIDSRWDQDLLCNENGMEDSGIDYSTTIYSDPNTKNPCLVQSGSFEIESSTGFQLSSSSSPFASNTLLEDMFDGDSSYLMDQDGYFGNLGMISSTDLPENRSQFVDFPAMLMSSDQHQILPQHNKRSNHNKFTSKNHSDETPPPPRKNSGTDPPAKRQRIQTPSPLPTFKVRKEKLGDRVTALQQLVSPFGKTDTASVLHEAIEYIKLLHAQVNLLSAPYFKSEASLEQYQQITHEATKQGLRTRGLCLMPISISYPVAAEASTGFWTPTFERNFR